MALQKSIVNLRTGHANDYWRLTGVAIDAHTGHVALVLSGYANAAARQSGLQPDDRRDWTLGPAAYAAISAAASQGATVYETIAIACYTFMVAQRRPIPPGTLLNEDGTVMLPNGEVIAEADIDKSDESGQWTVPSEFADAVSV